MENILSEMGYCTNLTTEKILVLEGMQKEIVREVQNRGHFEAAKTEELIKHEFYILRFTQQVEAVITNCVKRILQGWIK